MKVTFKSPEIRCNGCANNIRASLPKNPGVQKVDVDPATKVVSVDYDEAVTDAGKVAEALTFLGYPVEAASK